MGEDAAALKGMAAQLAAILQVQGEKGWEAWRQLHGKLGEVAATAAGDDPKMAVEPLLKEAKDASCLADLAGNSIAQDSMRSLEKRFRDVSKANPDLLRDLVLLVAGELSMVPLADSKPVHMINEQGNFCGENVDIIIKGSAKLSASCAVVSIVGAQSSGKSYLLNCLFGSKFPVMNAQLGRSQTSRGIMISRCMGPSLLVLDVEGSDGEEKGQDTLFEKQAALFVLAASDLMIFNIEMGNIGREQGSGRDLYRIIFKERIKLQGAGVTKILVAIRRYDGATPIQTLGTQIKKSLKKIWEEVNGVSVNFQDYIEVNFIGLPDKDMPTFPEEVKKLRTSLSDTRSAQGPISGLSLSFRLLWSTIKETKELDIPSHRVAVARLYCQKVVENILNSLDSQEKYKLLKAQVSPGRFKQISHELLEENKTEYDLKAEMYDPNVRGQERQYLVERLRKIFTNDSREVIWKLQEKKLEEFKGAFYKNTEKMKGDDADVYFAQIMDAYIVNFVSSCEALKEFDSQYLHQSFGDLKKKMQSHVALHIVEVKVTIARLYCGQLVKDTLSSFDSQELLQAGESPGRFTEISHKLLGKIMTEYDVKTKMYDPDVRDKERQYLEERLHEIFKNHSSELIWKVRDNIVEQFKREFDGRDIKTKQQIADYVDKYIKEFMSSFKDPKLFDFDKLQTIRGELKKKLELHADQELKKEREMKAKEVKKIIMGLNLGVSVALTAVNMAVGMATGDMITPIFTGTQQILTNVTHFLHHYSPSTSEHRDLDSPSPSQDHDLHSD